MCRVRSEAYSRSAIKFCMPCRPRAATAACCGTTPKRVKAVVVVQHKENCCGRLQLAAATPGLGSAPQHDQAEYVASQDLVAESSSSCNIMAVVDGWLAGGGWLVVAI